LPVSHRPGRGVGVMKSRAGASASRRGAKPR
jgi:hypothetical protein